MSKRRWEIAEQLTELDPLGDYSQRGAKSVADLVGASGYRLVLGEEMIASAGLEGAPTLSLPLEAGDRSLGILHLYGSIAEDVQWLADWGGRVFARGISTARRLDDQYGARTVEDVNAMLERMPLTPREKDVVGRLLSGSSTRQIASSTGLTIATVNTYLKRIFAKLGVHSRVELVARVTGTHRVISGKSASANEAPEPRAAPREAEAPSP